MTELDPGEILRRARARFKAVPRIGEALAESIEKWSQAEPFTLEPVIAHDRMSWSLIMEVKAAPLDEWGRQFAHAVNDLRSCLNHLAMALALSEGKPAKPKRIQFPIAATPEEWKNQKSWIAELPERARKAIEDIQPFQRTLADPPGSASSDLLVHLRDLSNQDKHHVAIVPEGTLQEVEHAAYIKFRSKMAAAMEGSPEVTLVGKPIFERGEILIWKAKSEVDSVGGQFTFTGKVVVISPERDMPLGLTEGLSLLIQYVAQVVDHVLSETNIQVPES